MATLITDFFSQLSPNERLYLEHIGSRYQLDNHEHLFQSNKHPPAVFIIRSGRIKIYELSDKGKEIILWFCFPGELFGLAELNQTINRKIFAESCGKSDVLCIPSHDFRQFLDMHHHIAMKVIDLLSHRLNLLAERLLNISSDDVATRLMKLLKRFAMHYGEADDDSCLLNIRLTHQELGDMIGASRQTVTTTFSQLTRDGYLEKEGGKLRLLHYNEADTKSRHELQ